MQYALIVLLLIATDAVGGLLIVELNERHRINDFITLTIEVQPWTDPVFADLSDVRRGEAAATRDLHHDIRRLVVYGFIHDGESIDATLRPFGYRWLFGGRLIGGRDYHSGLAYNHIMGGAGREQFGEPFQIVTRSMWL